METKYEVGFVTKAQDYLIFIEGLPSVRVNDIVVTASGGRALVTSLLGDQVEALMLDLERPKPGEMIKNLADGIRLTLGQELLGRAINPVGVPIDGKGSLPTTGSKLDLEVVAPGISYRQLITDQLHTGFAIVDLLIPIAKGQRELVFGDARSGKSSFLLDLITNQKDQNMICVYTSIGKPEIETKRFFLSLEASGASSYSVVIAASAGSSAPLIALAPSVALSIADAYAKRGADVLVILDDLGAHSKYLREIALLGQRVPGRESYPADIFYAHSHLIERAGRFKKETQGQAPDESPGGATITLLPVIETDLENFTSLIPTNLISQTDGHLLFSSLLRSQGDYPAIDWSLSVTRVGRQTQPALSKSIGNKIRSLLAEYQELERYSKFESELSVETQLKLKQASLALELLNQEGVPALGAKTQAALLTLIFTDYFETKDRNFVAANKLKLIKALENEPALRNLLEQNFETIEDLRSGLSAQLGPLENYVHSL